MAATRPSVTNLKAWWKFDEESGTRLDSRDENHLSDNNTVTYGTGVQGNSAQFDNATSEYLSRADTADVSAGDTDFTVGGWAKFHDLTAIMDFVYKGAAGAAAGDEYVIRYDQGTDRFNYISAYAAGWDTLVAATFGGAAAINTWYFIIIQHDASGNEIGISINAGVIDTAATTGAPNDTANPLYMGGHPTVGRYLDGELDEWFFWREKLSQDEIDWLYNTGSGRTFSDVAIFVPRTVGIF